MSADEVKRIKYAFLFRRAVEGELYYLAFMLAAYYLFHREFDYYDCFAGAAMGIIFGNMNWRDKQKRVQAQIVRSASGNNIQCPCCGYFTIRSDDEVIVEICDVCFWQYDLIAHERPHISIGANKLSLNEAVKNYKRHGVCKVKKKHLVREPIEEELPENNV
ncbi:cysteine-rich CPCC protein [Paenibacillus sp. BK033]|uniref:CPCC family cysteine-rich protein n=1 Tax=Paenibacillus sp. BK033 TaxID=2512133 RepID=UPI0010D8B80E|nr:CPCC family cysteine-rich protein [Paenibacillus sp. BK033]TCM97906.1 cysteine-rich CPCC protein [Paenibacillus sp. BK033]